MSRPPGRSSEETPPPPGRPARLCEGRPCPADRGPDQHPGSAGRALLGCCGYPGRKRGRGGLRPGARPGHQGSFREVSGRVGIFGKGGQRWASSGCPSESWVMGGGQGWGVPGADTMTNGSEGEAAGPGPRMCPAAPGSTRLKGRNVSWRSHEKPFVSGTLSQVLLMKSALSRGASDTLGEMFPAALGLCMLRGLGGAQGRWLGACWGGSPPGAPPQQGHPRGRQPDLQAPTFRHPRARETQVCPESAGALLSPEHKVSVGSPATWPHHRGNMSEPRGPRDMPQRPRPVCVSSWHRGRAVSRPGPPTT